MQFFNLPMTNKYIYYFEIYKCTLHQEGLFLFLIVIVLIVIHIH